MEALNYRKFIKRFALAAALLLFVCAALIVVFDPFYHYHGPLPGLKAVVTKSEYQCIGTIRNFEYDSVLCGSSTAENYNNHWFDEAFGAKTVKAIKSSGTTADLKYYLEEAFATHDVKNVFYSLDLFALDGDPEANFVNDSMPLYLFDHNLLNDVKYVLNKDVLFEDVPYLLAMNAAGGYDEGTSYNWWQYKTFSEEETLRHYERNENQQPVLQREVYEPRVNGNVELIVSVVEAHPETQFAFFLPPYSILWWDGVSRSGQMQEYFYVRERVMDQLTGYENVKIFDFQSEEEIVLNLNHYMDPIHFSADVNHFMVEESAKENSEYRVTEENREEKLHQMENLVKRMLEEEIEKYF